MFRIRLFFDLSDSYPTSLVRGSEPTCLVDPDLHPDPDTHNFGHLNPHQGNADQQHCCKPTEILRNNGSGYRKNTYESPTKLLIFLTHCEVVEFVQSRLHPLIVVSPSVDEGHRAQHKDVLDFT